MMEITNNKTNKFGLLVSPPVTQTAQFTGKYFMLVYFGVCLVMGIRGIV